MTSIDAPPVRATTLPLYRVNLHYGGNSGAVTGIGLDTAFPDDPAFEIEYAPYGVDSGLCLGAATTAISHEGVTLQPCSVSSKSVWVLDTCDSWDSFTDGGFFPVINGSDTNFSPPFVLTCPANGVPGRQAAWQLP